MSVWLDVGIHVHAEDEIELLCDSPWFEGSMGLKVKNENGEAAIFLGTSTPESTATTADRLIEKLNEVRAQALKAAAR